MSLSFVNGLLASLCLPLHALQLNKQEKVDCHNGGFEFPGPCIQKPPAGACSKEVLPTVLYLGLPHSGSTSLAQQLNMHPDLSYGKVKEHQYFVSAGSAWHTPNSPNNHKNHYHSTGDYLAEERTPETYKGEFLVDCDTKQTFDGTPYNLYLGNKKTNCTKEDSRGCIFFHFHEPGLEAVQKVKKVLGGDLKLVAMIRDPIDMVTSQYPDPSEYAEVLKNHKWKTCYADSLLTWMEVFPKENFLFLDSDEYFRDLQTTLSRVFEFAGLAPKRYTSLELDTFGRRRSSAARTASLSPRLRRAFHKTPYNKRCKALLEFQTGMKLNWKDAEDAPLDPHWKDLDALEEKDSRFDRMANTSGCRCHETSRNFGAKLGSLDACKDQCMKTTCMQMDYSIESGLCNTYTSHCSTDKDCAADWVAYRKRSPNACNESIDDVLTSTCECASSGNCGTGKYCYDGACNDKAKAKFWFTINATAACEQNYEKIERVFGDKVKDLDECKSKCQSNKTCVAIDFYTNSSWCNTYDEACIFPLNDKHGAASYALRTEEAVAATGPLDDEGILNQVLDEVIKESLIADMLVAAEKETRRKQKHTDEWWGNATDEDDDDDEDEELVEELTLDEQCIGRVRCDVAKTPEEIAQCC